MSDFTPEPGYEFTSDDVLAHWHLTACRARHAQMVWQQHIEDPFK